MQENTEIKIQSTDRGANSYSGDPLDHVTVEASGNANVTVTLGDKENVKKNEKRDTSDKEEIEQSFSVDYYLQSIPLTGWLLIIVAMIALLGAVWWFLKTTMIGKALDSGIAKGIEMTESAIDRVRDKLSDAEKGSAHHTDLQNELIRLRKEQGEYLRKSKK